MNRDGPDSASRLRGSKWTMSGLPRPRVGTEIALGVGGYLLKKRELLGNSACGSLCCKHADWFAPLTSSHRHNIIMPMTDTPKMGMPAGTLPMLILRVLQSGTLHGYAIAQRIHVLSSEVLAVEEGLLYPTLQKMLVKGWVKAEWGTSETGRKVRFYRLTPDGRQQLKQEVSGYDRVTQAIREVLRTA